MPQQYGSNGINSDGTCMNTGNSIWDPATGGRPSIRLHKDKSAMAQSVAPWLRNEDESHGKRVVAPSRPVERRPATVDVRHGQGRGLPEVTSPSYDILQRDIHRLRGTTRHSAMNDTLIYKTINPNPNGQQCSTAYSNTPRAS